MRNQIILLISLLLSVSVRAGETEKVPLGALPPEACGVWSWYSYGGTPSKWNGKITADETYAGLRGIPIVVGWDELEPEDGVYRWDLFDNIIKKAAANDKYIFTLLWINPTEPQWLYDKGVPKVEIDTFKGDPNFGIQAYPMDEKYKFYSERIITKLAEHLRSLPPELFKRVVFHQVVEGSTGDGFCYKGEPKDPRYNVTREEWADYQTYIRRFTVDAFSKPMDGKPPMALLIHTEDVAAGLKYYPGTVLKQGVPSHGYGSNTERSKFNGYKPWMTPDNPAGRPVFSRGEGETMIPRKGQTTEHSKWFQQNPQQNLYWTALGALQNGLDIWNLPEFVIEDPQWRQSLDIFNRYAGQKYPSKSPVAFCALRDELNSDDTVRFPENIYGSADKKNTDRVLKICAEFADQGAVVQDLDKALAGGLKSRSRTGYNDVAWDRIDEDYSRFLYPIDKLETSVGWWNVGPKDQPYGKFARGFEHKSGKDALYFGFHKDFFKNGGEPVGPLTFRVVWFDNTTGSWSFSYDAENGNFKSAKTFTGTGTGRWREETFTITDAVMNHNGPRGADIALVNLDDKDKIFHLIEVSRDPKAQPVTGDSADKSADAKAGRKAANKKEHDFGKWEKAIAAYEKEDAANPPPRGGIQFVGSSTIRKWTTLEQDFPGQPLFNRGFGGSQIKDTTFFASRIIIPYAPRIIVFHAGDNDLAAGATPEQVIADLKELVATIQAKLPETEFCYISLKPSVKRERLRAEQQKVNEGATELSKSNSRFRYIDQYHMVTDAKGNPRPELFAADGLHLSEAGYKLLVERVRPFLKEGNIADR